MPVSQLEVCTSKLITRSLEYTFVILSLVTQQISPFHLTRSTHLGQPHMYPCPPVYIHTAHRWSHLVMSKNLYPTEGLSPVTVPQLPQHPELLLLLKLQLWLNQ